jgi:hypothetical protein
MNVEGPVIHHKGISFTLVPSEQCVAIGQALHEKGLKWHIHVLTPGCPHNPFDREYAMVIEDNSHHRAYIASSKDFPEADRVLVRLLHGDDILKADAVSTDASQKVASPLVAYVEQLELAGKPWHHHMHFPECIMNPHPGKWAISIDSDEPARAETFEQEPLEVLRQLEVMHFSALDGQH